MPSQFAQIISACRSKELRHLLSMGLQMEDAEDVFQEASVVLFKAMSQKELPYSSKPEAYLHGICDNIGKKQLLARERQRNTIDEGRLDRMLELSEEPADDEPSDGCYHAMLEQILDELSPRDKAMIYGFYIEGKSMQELAEEQHMSGAEVARTTKCRIISKMRRRATELLNQQ